MEETTTGAVCNSSTGLLDTFRLRFPKLIRLMFIKNNPFCYKQKGFGMSQ